MRISVVLLAAGRSERMGEQKALIPFGLDTLLGYQLRQLASLDAVREIVVVTGFNPEPLRPIIAAEPKAREAHNPAFDTGKVSSIVCGLAAVDAEADAMVLLAVDQPRPAPVLRAVVDEHAASRALITVPVHDGHRGHPVIFARALFGELQAIDEATLGARAVLERHAGEINEVPCADPIVRVDVNTPADAERARGMLGVGS